jgi:tRNA(Ile)-lysidine synthetase-like protein
MLPSPGNGFGMDLTEACFDADALPQRLIVRNFRRGDRFEPRGMNGHKKLKDLFIDRGCTVRAGQIADLDRRRPGS